MSVSETYIGGATSAESRHSVQVVLWAHVTQTHRLEQLLYQGRVALTDSFPRGDNCGAGVHQTSCVGHGPQDPGIVGQVL